MASVEPTRLVLWDIDHTLLDGGDVSRDAYNSAFTHITARPMERLADMTGKTELLIAADTLRLHGITPDAAVLRSFIEAVARELELRADVLAARGRALPGATSVLKALSEIDGVHQSVLTGNMRVLAELKLRVFGLDDHLDLEAGAYGDDAEQRVALLPIAWERSRLRFGRSFTGTDTVIVGDTLLDVATAKAGGAMMLGVATGSVTAEELKRSGADAVFSNLEDTRSAVEAITGLCRN